MGTVFCIPDAAEFAAQVHGMFRGEVVAGQTIVDVNYPNLLASPDADLATGAATLNTLLTSTAGVKTVLAHGFGALVASRWLHDYGPTSTILPANLKFIFGGNSTRKYNGYYRITNYNLYGIFPAFISANNNVPDATPYSVRDIAIQYDGWSDYPNDTANWNAVWIAEGGKNLYHVQPYMNIPLSRFDYAEYVAGNITYVLVPTQLSGVSAGYVSGVEAAYTRPFTSIEPGTDPTAIAAKAYGLAMESLLEGRIDIINYPLMCMLVTATYVPNQNTHKFKSIVIGEITGSGYAAGGKQITGVDLVYDSTAKKLTLLGGNLAWPTVTFTGVKYGVLYVVPPGAPASAMPILGYINFGTPQNRSDAPFYVTWPVTGIMTLAVP